MIYLFDEFSLDDKACEIRRKGKRVKLEKRVFNLILLLLEHRERVMFKAELFDLLWEGRRVSESSLSVAVTAARKALDDTQEPHRIIQTEHGRGYRFVASVSTLDATSDYCPASTPGDAGGLLREFVGRRNELNLLFDAYSEAELGRRRLVLISGEPGIGKSRLVGEFAGKAVHRGAVALVAKCLEQDGAPPYWPWIQALRQAASSSSFPSHLRALATRALAMMSPEDGTPHPVDGGGGGASRARFRLFDLVRQLLCEVSTVAPLLLCIDDVHRADPASLLLLEFVSQQIDNERLMILLADRDAETRKSPLHSDLMSRVCRLGGAGGFVLNGLDADDIAVLIPVGADASSLRELTGGNPFFLSQLLPMVSGNGDLSAVPLRERLPFSVRDAIGRHLEGLTLESRKTLQCAAVIGREFDSTLLALAEPKAMRLTQSLSEAASSRLIERRQSRPGEFRFVHALVRDLIYDSIEPESRIDYHRGVASALARVHGEMGGPLSSEYAFHMFNAADPESARRCIDACLRAGSVASAQLAYEESALQYSRGLELANLYAHNDLAAHCDIHLGLGAEISRIGDRPRARSHFMRAVGLSRTLKDPRRLALAALGCFPGFFAVEAGAPDVEVIELLREALAVVRPEDSGTRALLLSRLAMAIAWYERGTERQSLCSEATNLAETLGDPGLQVQVLLARWFAEWDPSAFDERWTIAQDLISRASRVDDNETLLLCRLFWVTCLLERGEIAEFRREAAVFQDAAVRLRQPEALWYAALLRAVDALHSGELKEAERHSASFFAIGRLVGDANVFHSRMAQRFLIAREQAEWDLLIRIASEAADAYPGVVGWRATKAWALSEAGRLDEARREFMALASDGFENIPRRMDWSVTMALLSEVAVALGARSEGQALYVLMEPLRGKLIVLGLCVLTWGCGSQFLGKLQILSGRYQAGALLLEEAATIEDSLGARAWAARSRLALAELLRDPHLADDRWQRADVIQRCKRAAMELGLIDVKRRLQELGTLE